MVIGALYLCLLLARALVVAHTETQHYQPQVRDNAMYNITIFLNRYNPFSSYVFFSSKLYTLSQKCTHNVLNPTFYIQNGLLISNGKHSFKITINLMSKMNFEFKSELSGQLTNTTLTTDKPHLKIKLCFQSTTHSLQNPVNLFSKINFHVKSKL